MDNDIGWDTKIVNALIPGKGYQFVCGHHQRFRPEHKCPRVLRLQSAAVLNGYKLRMQHIDGDKFRELQVLKEKEEVNE